ncbi:hypothetical protein D3C87_1734910 [compost metagenome]
MVPKPIRKSLNSILPIQPTPYVISGNRWYIGELRGIYLQVSRKLIKITARPAVMVITHRPYPGIFLLEAPELLRDPKDASLVGMRPWPESITDHPDPDFGQDLYRRSIEGVRGSNPSIRSNPVLDKDRQCLLQFILLLCA